MVHITRNLATYPLPESVGAVLRHLDAAAQAVARAGGVVPDAIVLSDADFARVNAVVHVASGGVLCAGDVQWSGRRITCPTREQIAA